MVNKKKYSYILFACLFLIASEKLFAQKNKPDSTAHKKFSKDMIEKKSLVFFVIGDWGRNGEIEQQPVAEAMKRCAEIAKPEFVITTGDNFYCCGVASADDPQWMNSFENIYKSNDLQIDWYPVLGNHDYSGNVQAEIDYTKKSRKWVMPARYYTREMETKGGQKVKFLFVDSSPLVGEYRHNKFGKYTDVDLQDTVRQLKWIDSVLATSSQDTWKFVVGHHPVYSTSKHGNTKELQYDLKPLLEKYKVQAYICGHDHNFQHQKPKGGSVDYFISGAGSEVSDYVDYGPNTLFAKSAPGFMLTNISNNVLHVFFIDKDMNIIYEYSKTNTN